MSILRKPAQLMNTVGAMWHTVTSWLLFSTLWLACLRVLRMAMAFLGPRPHTNCNKFDTLDSCSARFRSTPTSLVRFTNSRLNPSSNSSLSSWSYKICKFIIFHHGNLEKPTWNGWNLRHRISSSGVQSWANSTNGSCILLPSEIACRNKVG